MPWTLERSEAFDRAIKALSKKFPSAESDTLSEFRTGPIAGAVPLPKYARKVWKGRIASSDLNRGKSGGFRIIYYWDSTLPNWCCLGPLYFKGECEDLAPDELDRLMVSFKSKLAVFTRLMDEANEKKNSGN